MLFVPLRLLLLFPFFWLYMCCPSESLLTDLAVYDSVHLSADACLIVFSYCLPERWKITRWNLLFTRRPDSGASFSLSHQTLVMNLKKKKKTSKSSLRHYLSYSSINSKNTSRLSRRSSPADGAQLHSRSHLRVTSPAPTYCRPRSPIYLPDTFPEASVNKVSHPGSNIG